MRINWKLEFKILVVCGLCFVFAQQIAILMKWDDATLSFIGGIIYYDYVRKVRGKA